MNSQVYHVHFAPEDEGRKARFAREHAEELTGASAGEGGTTALTVMSQ